MDISSLLYERELILSGRAALHETIPGNGGHMVDSKDYPDCELFTQDACNILLSSIQLEIITKFREETGQGMMDCKHALTECDYNIERAKRYLKHMHRYTI